MKCHTFQFSRLTMATIMFKLIGSFVVIFLLVRNTTAEHSPQSLMKHDPLQKTLKDLAEDVHVIVKNEEEEKRNKNIIREPLTSPVISETLRKINNRLRMKGESERKQHTDIQEWWIKRFKTSIFNWVDLATTLLPNPEVVKMYNEIRETYFDGWTVGKQDAPFQMTYKMRNDPTKEQTWNIILLLTSFDGFGLTKDLKIKSFDIYFTRSKKKSKATDGKMVYRKDRVYDIALSCELPSSKLRIKYEIIKDGEKSLYNPLEYENAQTSGMKLGTMRLKLNTIKLDVKIVLTEIDKRFVKEDPITHETYYFLVPEIQALQLSVASVERHKINYQKHPNYSIETGILGHQGLTKGKAQKVIIDFTDLIASKDENERAELANRIRVALINRFARPIMVSKDPMLIGPHVDEENSYFKPVYPWSWVKPDELAFAKKTFYVSYANDHFVSTAFKVLFKIDWTKDIDITEQLLQLFLEQQTIRASVNIDVTDDGFDYDEDARIERVENLIKTGKPLQEAENIVREEYDKMMTERKVKRIKELKKRLSDFKKEQRKLEEEQQPNEKTMDDINYSANVVSDGARKNIGNDASEANKNV